MCHFNEHFLCACLCVCVCVCMCVCMCVCVCVCVHTHAVHVHSFYSSDCDFTVTMPEELPHSRDRRSENKLLGGQSNSKPVALETVAPEHVTDAESESREQSGPHLVVTGPTNKSKQRDWFKLLTLSLLTESCLTFARVFSNLHTSDFSKNFF